MKNPLNIRQNFYQGQSVSASNLTQLQDYSDNARNLIVSDILGYGIVSGFHVTKDTTNNFILGVGRGLAYTEQGVRLESDTEKTINTKEFIESSQLPIDDEKITRYLTISLDYDKTKPVTDSFNNSVLTEWTPTVKATLHLDKTSHTINDLLIAEIIIGQKGVLTITKIVDKFSNSKNPNIIDMFYPLKSTYTQYPNKTTGLFDETETPLALYGGDWELVATKIFNNVPETETDVNGTYWKYPNRTLIVKGGTGSISDTNDQYPKQTLPYPFIDTEYSKNIKLDIVGVNGSNILYALIGGDWLKGVAMANFTTTTFTINITGIIGTTLQPWFLNYEASGYWKILTDPISTDEEKNYVKIWKRINPPTEV